MSIDDTEGVGDCDRGGEKGDVAVVVAVTGDMGANRTVEQKAFSADRYQKMAASKSRVAHSLFLSVFSFRRPDCL